MKLIYIGMMLDPDDFSLSTTFASDFGFKCRFIGNYLTRKLKEAKFNSADFNRVAIIAKEKPNDENEVFEKFLRVSVPFDKTQYVGLASNALADYFAELYEEGIIKASPANPMPFEFLLARLREFKSNNYINEWGFKSKSFKEIGIKATLNCKMTMDFFSLVLVLTKRGEIIFSKEILNTLPDEIIYHYQFKEIVLEVNEIKVLDHFQKAIYTLDLMSLP
jgi:hypothetical protein